LYLSKLVQQHPYLSYERLRMAGLDDCNILQSGHLVLVDAHDSISMTNEHLAQLDLSDTRVSRRTRYPCNSNG
jgi:hypothetical protein